VTESNATIRLLQPRGSNLHCVVFVHAREDLSLSYERKLYQAGGALQADPRVSHGVTLEVDDYGNVIRSVSIAYGRLLRDRSGLLTDADHARQATLLATVSHNRYTNVVNRPDAYRTPALAEKRLYELVHLPNEKRLFRFEEISRLVAWAGDGSHDLPYEDVNAEGATGPGPYRRLVGDQRNFYRSDDLARLLPLGGLEAMALPGESLSLTLTPGLIARIYGGKLAEPEAVLRHDGGYVDLDGDGSAWMPSGRIFYSPDPNDDATAELAVARRHFFLPRRFRDPFGNISFVNYDRHDLMPIETRDPVGNVVRARIDYRVSKPDRVIDANGNRSDVAFDALARVAGTAVMGKEAEAVGDSLEGFVADLPEQVVLAHLADPLRDPWTILGNATTRLLYDVFAFDRTRRAARPQPAVTGSLARETHVSDLAPRTRTKIQHSFAYSDGFGREVQRKLQAAPGMVPGHGNADPRWIGSGWTVFNNKGDPVRRYEPFFSATHRFEFAAMAGVAATMVYDAAGRVIATLNPDHTFAKTVFDPWRQEVWDANDTVLLDARRDPDVGPLLRGLPSEDYLPTWYQQRTGGALGPSEREAAIKAAAHADTPGTSFADPLGRTFLSVAHNRFSREGVEINEFYPARSELDIQGNQLSVTDPLGRAVMTYDYDLGRRKIHQHSSDAGQRWTAIDVAGKPLLSFDSRQHRLRYRYDALRRPIALFVTTGDGPERLAERSEYGESQADAASGNLRGHLYRQEDGAGVVTTPLYDFTGNLRRSVRQLLADYREPADWRASTRVEAEVFSSETAYDALNRPVAMTAPDGSVIRPRYNDANLLERIDVSLKASDDFTTYVRRIDYNARGQRTFIAYGNGARSLSTYDPLTFRLTHLETTRASDGAVLQDLKYAYDPVGNISAIADAAQQTVYFRNQVVRANGDYLYDAIYRLISATGREHAGVPGRPETSYDDAGRAHLLLPGDGQAMHNYREHYHYDAAGNILQLIHAAADGGSWRRHYGYDEIAANNRLSAARVGDDIDHFLYDPNGNMTRMAHLPVMSWDFKDQIAATRTQVLEHGGSAPTTYYLYDSSGQRIRKVTDDGSGLYRNDRVYVGGFELYREYSANGDRVTLERSSLHVMDDKRRIVLVESRDNETTIRYQFDNHLGSACLELDPQAAVITYEEYHPYGSTSYQAGRSIASVSLKQYRFTGKERDSETGLYYHGARYYAPWLGRWTSCDPLGTQATLNGLAYGKCNPLRFSDPTGLEDNDWPKGKSFISPDNQARRGTIAHEEVLPEVAERINIGDFFSADIEVRTLPGGSKKLKSSSPGEIDLRVYGSTQGERILDLKPLGGTEDALPQTRRYAIFNDTVFASRSNDRPVTDYAENALDPVEVEERTYLLSQTSPERLDYYRYDKSVPSNPQVFWLGKPPGSPGGTTPPAAPGLGENQEGLPPLLGGPPAPSAGAPSGLQQLGTAAANTATQVVPGSGEGLVTAQAFGLFANRVGLTQLGEASLAGARAPGPALIGGVVGAPAGYAFEAEARQAGFGTPASVAAGTAGAVLTGAAAAAITVLAVASAPVSVPVLAGAAIVGGLAAGYGYLMSRAMHD
jgi:RHS repeat-associated protein